MTQIGESMFVAPEPTEEKPEEEEKKKKVKLRFSLFFDGTLNNRTNTAERKANSDVYKKVQRSWFQSFRGYGSYENEVSNVGKMEEYVDKACDVDNSEAFYVEGMGTIDRSTDTFLGKALGQGEAGIGARAKSGFNQIIWAIQDWYQPDDIIIEKITIDAFGFSRGAATARHFINYVLDEAPFQTYKLSRQLKRVGFEIEKIEVEFVGLYDTVASLGLPIEHKLNAKLLRLNAVSFANQVVQLAAAEEHRANFSLSNIDSAGGKGKEIYLPGVHSDIGGGYVDNALEAQIINKRLRAQLEEEMQQLIDAGWYDCEEIKIDCPEKGNPRVPKGSRICKLVVNRYVAAEYDRIPLQIMAEFAREAGLNIKSALETENDVRDPKLVPIKDELKAYAKKGGSKPEDWQNNKGWLPWLRHAHLHYSAHYSSTGMEPRFINGKRKRLYYDG
ncbi:T6SS phospholipase effector Tle1-like catalytic domain-containing protein [Aliikangiella coralliicola]|uniref:DUF2235 domain-containing protein n=1 Tax=Aliikangiella coralliicola TaxID=2592383 RepID=A0A545UF77_9GAMM|nr:DUF2235 domain-containing protein [Aliikangiella coralliicola]TQV88043.1 DUF2235 domain-containing protein [Aliikangiella coralliicola]